MSIDQEKPSKEGFFYSVRTEGYFEGSLSSDFLLQKFVKSCYKFVTGIDNNMKLHYNIINTCYGKVFKIVKESFKF